MTDDEVEQVARDYIIDYHEWAVTSLNEIYSALENAGHPTDIDTMWRVHDRAEEILGGLLLRWMESRV